VRIATSPSITLVLSVHVEYANWQKGLAQDRFQQATRTKPFANNNFPFPWFLVVTVRVGPTRMAADRKQFFTYLLMLLLVREGFV
jgi:hypothetical protein